MLYLYFIHLPTPKPSSLSNIGFERPWVAKSSRPRVARARCRLPCFESLAVKLGSPEVPGSATEHLILSSGPLGLELPALWL